MAEQKNLYMVFGLIIILAILVCCFNMYPGGGEQEKYTRKSVRVAAPKPRKDSIEKFTALAANSGTHVGMLNNSAGFDDSYDLIPGFDSFIPQNNFADMVDQGDLPNEFVAQPKTKKQYVKGMKRLNDINASNRIPRIAGNITPFNIETASPTGSAAYMVGVPIVNRKSKYHETSVSSSVRGDLRIKHYPNQSVIGVTHHTTSDSNPHGLFTKSFDSMFIRNTGSAYHNYP